MNEIRGIVECVVSGGHEGRKRTWCRCRNLLLLRFFVRDNSVFFGCASFFCPQLWLPVIWVTPFIPYSGESRRFFFSGVREWRSRSGWGVFRAHRSELVVAEGFLASLVRGALSGFLWMVREMAGESLKIVEEGLFFKDDTTFAEMCFGFDGRRFSLVLWWGLEPKLEPGRRKCHQRPSSACRES